METSVNISLEGKVAVVTGAAGGIGLAAVKKLSDAGAKVMMLDINKEKGEKKAEQVENAKFYYCNVANEKDCQMIAEKAKEEYGRVDVIFNNAGIIRRKNAVDLPTKDWQQVLDVNLTGIFLLSKHLIPLMAEEDGGSIINTGSGWGLKGGGDAVSYCATKGGVVNMTRGMAIDHGPQGIRVNSVSPGDTDTELLRGEAKQLGADEEEFMKEAGDRPLGRVGTPEDIANAVLFLASDLSSWITGTDILVDGGGLA